MTVDLVAPERSQRALIGALDRERSGRLMAALDACNRRHGRGSVFPAAAGVERQRKRWATKFELRSPRYTTRLDEVPVVGRT
jgi:DNA polymerase V